MHLSNHGVAGHAIAEQTRDLARAFAVNPMLLELLDYLVRPSHCRLVRRFLAKGGRLLRIPSRRLARTRPSATLISTRSETRPTTSRGLEGENYTTR
jgi:hypothetical protein